VGNVGLGNITLREAVAADRGAIEALSMLTMREHETRLPDNFLPRDAVHTKWLDYIFGPAVDERSVPFARLIVACLDDRVVGHLLLLFNFSNRGDHGRDLKCHVSDLSILPDLRGRGIGTLLMQRVQTVLREEQFTEVEAYVWRGNDASHKLFQNAAFVPAATLYTTRLGPPFPPTVQSTLRPAAPQSSWLLLGIMARIVAALAWAKWRPQ
jgi:GNAT superfamily N-acetyltransferase